MLGEWFRVPTPEWETVRWAWDKRNTYQLAKELGIPTPATHYIENAEQLSDLDTCRPPFVIKPAIKEHFIYATKAKAWRADSHLELKRLFHKAMDLAGPGEIMVQELIPGGGAQQFAYCAFFRDGEAIGKMVARRWRQHPLEFGRASTYVETVDLPILEDLSERFLRAINYYGLVEIEYKLDPGIVSTSCLTSTRGPGAITVSGLGPGWTSAICSTRIRLACRWRDVKGNQALAGYARRRISPRHAWPSWREI